MNPLKQLQEHGQSVWMDYVSRCMITSGELRRMVEDNSVSGMTSNPTIFEKAIDESTDYDEGLRKLLNTDSSIGAAGLYERLSVEDIRLAAEFFGLFMKTHMAATATSASRFHPAWRRTPLAVSTRHADCGAKWIART